jgi:hypothetical protein
MNYGITDNAFANSTTYDTLGRMISQTVNVDGNNNANFYLEGGIPFFDKFLTLSPSLNGNYNTNSGFINGSRNKTTTLNSEVGMGIQLQGDSSYFVVRYNYGYNHSSSTLNAASAKPYSDQSFHAEFEVKLPWKFSVNSNADYTINSQRAEGYNTNLLIWNAEINKAFLKNENLILTISANDLLNQNIHNSRNVQDNIITDSKTNVISRYFLLKLTYKFNSTHTKDQENDMF